MYFKSCRYWKKIGELFIKIATDYAVKNNMDTIYLTHYIKENQEDKLIALIQEWGFKNYGKNHLGENIYIKRLVPDVAEKYDKLEIAKIFYPTFYDGMESKKFIIPIQPQYHDRLFPK